MNWDKQLQEIKDPTEKKVTATLHEVHMIPYLVMDLVSYTVFGSYVKSSSFGYQDLFEQIIDQAHFIDISKAIQNSL